MRVSLRTHIMAILAERDTALRAALASVERSSAKADTATEKRFESVNEFRAQLAAQARDLMPRQESEQLMKAMSARIAALEGTGRQGALQVWSYIVGFIGLVGVLVTIYSKL